MYPNILKNRQKEVIKSLDLLGRDFYLAGGTGLALQLRHRTSVDLDFYTRQHFVPEKLLLEIRKRFKKLIIRRAVKDTLILSVNQTEVSLFYYPYKLLKPLVLFKPVYLASVEDIAAMKIAAIVQRGTRRDFIDIYYLLGWYSLEQIIKYVLRKYPGYQEMMILRALGYFEDAKGEELERGIEIFDKSFSWEKAKEKLFAEVKKYQLAMIKRDKR